MLTIFAAFPAKLRDILQDPSIIKAGVAILRESIFSFMDVRTPILYSEDCKKLWKDYEVNVSNCVELGLLARSADNPQWKGKYTVLIDERELVLTDVSDMQSISIFGMHVEITLFMVILF